MLTHIGIAVLTFLVTNIDDLLILSVYYGSDIYRPKNIVAGQYVGIGVLILISLSGLILGNYIPDKWIPLMGLFPLFLGIKDLLSLSKRDHDANEQPVKQKSTLQFVSVALVTVANGGDNIGVYTPLFATTEHQYIVVYVVLFLLLTGVWCLLSYYLVAHQYVKTILSRYGKIVLPFFLILLGLFILTGFFV